MERDPRDQRIAELEAKVAWAMGVIERLEKRVVELEAQLANPAISLVDFAKMDAPASTLLAFRAAHEFKQQV